MFVAMLTGALSALWNLLTMRLFGKRPDPETVEAKRDETIAEEQASIVADRTRPDAAGRLHDHEF